MEKFKELLGKCKCGVYLTVNEHRDYYKTAAQVLEEADDRECPPEIEEAVRCAMVETNTIIKLHFYPDTPIGCYEIWNYDIDLLLQEAMTCFDS